MNLSTRILRLFRFFIGPAPDLSRPTFKASEQLSRRQNEARDSLLTKHKALDQRGKWEKPKAEVLRLVK